MRSTILLGVLALAASPSGAQQATEVIAAKHATQPDPRAGSTEAAPLQHLGAGNRLWSISLASLTATRERPIFSPSRRPPPAVASPITSKVPSTTNLPPLALVGAIANEDEGIAIFLDSPTNKIIRLKTGDSHAGWTLKTVKAREAILQNEQRTAVVSLPNPPAR